MGKDGRDAERVTTTLSRARKREIEALAEREGVTIAWIMRRAVERYLDSVGRSSVVGEEMSRHA